MLSNTCKYAIRAVIYLAIHHEEGKKIGIKQISKDLNIPSPFLGKILQTLAKSKLLISTKGPHGGFALGKDAKEITLLDIIKIIDGLDFFETCMIGLEVCKEDKTKQKLCAFHAKSEPIRNDIYELFKNQTIEELATRFEENGITVNL